MGIYRRSSMLTMSCATAGRGWSTNCSDGGWATIPFSDRVDYGLLWEDITSLVSKRFEMEMVTKESGYIRTKWEAMGFRRIEEFL
jgi:hypothetical protein